LLDLPCIQQQEPFSYDGSIATLQSQSTRACVQAIICKECSPQNPCSSAKWQTQVKQASAAFICVDSWHEWCQRLSERFYGGYCNAEQAVEQCGHPLMASPRTLMRCLTHLEDQSGSERVALRQPGPMRKTMTQELRSRLRLYM